MNVHEIMTTQPQVCGLSESLDKVARKMWDHDCGAIPIVDEQNRPVGILTDRDIAMASMLNHRPLWEITAGDLTGNQDLRSCAETDSVESCLAVMEKFNVRRVPVTDSEGRLAGIISMGDAVAFTDNGVARVRQQNTLSPKQTLSMLKAISAHHASNARAVLVGQ